MNTMHSFNPLKSVLIMEETNFFSIVFIILVNPAFAQKVKIDSLIKLVNFVQDTAGQFKAPLSTLRGICYLGKMEITDQEELAQLEVIEKTVEEIARTLEPLNDLSSKYDGVGDNN